MDLIVDATLHELGISDEPAPLMDFDAGVRYRDLLIAINGRSLSAEGIEFVPVDRGIPQDLDLRPHQTEIPAGDYSLLVELASRYGIDVSHF